MLDCPPGWPPRRKTSSLTKENLQTLHKHVAWETQANII